ncbi:MAG: class I SAM-dependent methyltransferase, partial [Shewanella sp.]|nr:class I SAM-dependent methyltransferase [Shewanella sp.]
VTIKDGFAELASKLLNYLSMDFNVDEDMAALLRSSAFRRPQNARGNVPKAMRYWASNMRTLSDKDSYTNDFWCLFRRFHGSSVLDFGSGLSRAAPFLRKKGIDALDFEPYMIDMAKNKSQPDINLSRVKAKQFLTEVGSGRPFDSIFLCSVLNSVPFAEDRLKVLCIVHALSGYGTQIYGTCRDISDYNYEYGGIRQANYFVFDSEAGVRIGDIMSNPKIQKFHTINEADDMLSRFWSGRDFHKGGNVFYFHASSPKRINYPALIQSLRFEFNLPYRDGTMGLDDYALEMFGERLGVDLFEIEKQQVKKGKTKKAAK